VVSVLQHTGLVLLYLVIFLVNLLIFAGIPGGWIGLGIVFIYDAAAKFSVVGWPWWIVMAVLLVAGEIVEAFLGSFVVLKKGASKWAALGAFAGGLLGAILGTSVMPVVGSVIFGLLGAFGGAVLAEYIQYERRGEAVQAGFWAFIGKLSAYFIKFALAMAVVIIFIVRSWP
jgi:uncharacterized protein YqgC (DUF456 family)